MIVAMVRPHKIDDVKQALTEAGVHGMSIAEIKGFGRTGGKTEVFRGSAYQVDFVPKLRVEVVVTEAQVHPVLDAHPYRRARRNRHLERRPDHVVDVLQEDLAVADLAGPRAVDDRADHGIDLVVGAVPFEEDLREQRDDVSAAHEDLSPAPAPAGAVGVGQRHVDHPEERESLEHRLELLLADDRLDLRHGRCIPRFPFCA
jgi:hypothetical protein